MGEIKILEDISIVPIAEQETKAKMVTSVLFLLFHFCLQSQEVDF